jgi:sterol 3beta-glucosyltransferase
MRAVMTNFGTTGDVEPFLALAVELRRHGHEPILALSPYYADRVAEFGIAFAPIGPDLQKIQNDINLVVTTRPEVANSIEHIQSSYTPVALALPQMFAELRAVCQNADVLISGPMQPASRMVHELTGIPYVAVYLIYLGSRRVPDIAFQQISAAYINPFRTQLGLPPLNTPLVSSGASTEEVASPHLNLYAVSRHVVTPPNDWPAHHHMTGYFFLDNTTWHPDPTLVDFITAAKPPVVIGFGSMSHEAPEQLTDLILQAIEIAGCRAIIQRGWSGLGSSRIAPHVHMMGFVPHSWLFPQAACVVHHGATGTTAAMFRAGVPGVFVPHAYEHPLNAQVAHELGCAGPMIPYQQLTAERLGAAIRATLATERYYQAAAALGERIRTELGVQQARHLIERLVYKIGLQQEPVDGRGDAEVAEITREEKISRRKLYQHMQRMRKL